MALLLSGDFWEIEGGGQRNLWMQREEEKRGWLQQGFDACKTSVAHPKPQVDCADRQQQTEEHSLLIAPGCIPFLKGTQPPRNHLHLWRAKHKAGEQKLLLWERQDIRVRGKYNLKTELFFVASVPLSTSFSLPQFPSSISNKEESQG